MQTGNTDRSLFRSWLGFNKPRGSNYCTCFSLVVRVLICSLYDSSRWLACAQDFFYCNLIFVDCYIYIFLNLNSSAIRVLFKPAIVLWYNLSYWKKLILESRPSHVEIFSEDCLYICLTFVRFSNKRYVPSLLRPLEISSCFRQLSIPLQVRQSLTLRFLLSLLHAQDQPQPWLAFWQPECRL